MLGIAFLRFIVRAEPTSMEKIVLMSKLVEN